MITPTRRDVRHVIGYTQLAIGEVQLRLEKQEALSSSGSESLGPCIAILEHIWRVNNAYENAIPQVVKSRGQAENDLEPIDIYTYPSVWGIPADNRY